jgi:hypothetical protein
MRAASNKKINKIKGAAGAPNKIKKIYVVSADDTPAKEKDSRLLTIIKITTPQTSSSVAVRRADLIADKIQYLLRE